LSGYSGSPVFVYKPREKQTYTPTDDRRFIEETTSITQLVGDLKLIGIDCGHIQQYNRVLDKMLTPHPQGWKVERNTGMAIVIPAWRLEDLLNTHDFVVQRQRKNRQLLEEKEAEQRVAFDVKEPDTFTKETYQDALKRA
jgi:hypothetical protein